MVIGILTFFSNYNFGANLQAFSTYSYFKKQGHSPVMINWQPKSFAEEENINPLQQKAHDAFVQQHFEVSRLCRNDEDVVAEIERLGIAGVVIGSDVVLCYHSFINRIHLSRKTLVGVFKPEPSRGFPTPMWGSFYEKLAKKIPLFLMAASCSGSNNRFFEPSAKTGMKRLLGNFSGLYVRDAWTQQMIRYVSGGSLQATVVPDPVFGFNHNVPAAMTSREVIKRFGLPERYILLSFSKKRDFISTWVAEFSQIAKQNGYTCVGLAMPTGLGLDLEQSVDAPIDPLEWYSIIKHASGYVGQNMHPIVVSLHNAVPFFSFDKNQHVQFSVFRNVKASKTYQLLERAGMLEHWHSIATYDKIGISPAEVFGKILSFDKQKCQAISQRFEGEYLDMVQSIESIIAKNQTR